MIKLFYEPLLSAAGHTLKTTQNLNRRPHAIVTYGFLSLKPEDEAYLHTYDHNIIWGKKLQVVHLQFAHA